MTKLILAGLLCMSIHLASGQSNEEATVFEGILSLNSWVNQLSDGFNELFIEEKQQQCKRKLGYLGTDLEHLANEKRTFLLYAKNSDTYRMQTNIESMSEATREMIDHIIGLNTLMNTTTGRFANEELAKLKNDLLFEKMEMHQAMSADVNSGAMDKLVADTEKAIALLDEAAKAVWALRTKVMEAEE